MECSDWQIDPAEGKDRRRPLVDSKAGKDKGWLRSMKRNESPDNERRLI